MCKIGPSRTDQSDSCLAIDWFEVNKRVHEMLDLVKNSIGNDRRWDRVKRYFNLYELVSSSVHDIPSFAAYAPTSRSYFKLTELLVDHAADLTTPCASRSAFLCDAPGGFVEAYVMYRRRRDREQARGPGDWLGKDVMHAISLVGDACGGSGAPGWRLPRDLMRNNNIHLHGGGDEGDGDLYSLSNIDAFVIRAAPRSCDLVTADGGFDFSVDFNSQEKTSLRLLVSEVYTALLLQADGGCFLIKVYDLRLPATLRLLWLLHSCYTGGLVIDKPSSSRAANSEKFVVCKGFLRTGYVDREASRLRACISQGLGEVPLVDGIHHLPPAWFVREVALYNTQYITAQTQTIVETLSYMRSGDHVGALCPAPFPCLHAQVNAARAWCERYAVPMSSMALKLHGCHLTNGDGTKAELLASVAASHALSVPVPEPEAESKAEPHPEPEPTPVPEPKRIEPRDGASATHTPLSRRSRSPSTTPYKDGLLLPGRKLEGANWTRLPGGGPALARFSLIR